jgi:hypothetical protein
MLRDGSLAGKAVALQQRQQHLGQFDTTDAEVLSKNNINKT